MLTAEEIATLLNVSTRTVWRLDKAQKLPAALPLRRRRKKQWKESDIKKWLELGCPARTDFEKGKT